ncbi:putative ABC transport system permease protein [Ciceribacter lividus]|uniref:Putative ABC transport system permease protein n=1 Tax=Ciceribacter lividus TaxID=1197950 RepID=A0A6I7HSR9_9HYPH|nr:ABC transporter permease [Ciceribacter lividus]RCW27325.1 putative ABC transport system permease protein [Ciceribacter lividus]
MWLAGLGALLSHWRRQPLQFAMLFAGLALATGLWSGVQAINAEARASYGRAAAMLGQNRLEQLVVKDGGAIPGDRFAALRRGGWLVSPVVEGELRMGTLRLRLIGIDPLTLPAEARQLEVTGGEALRRFLTPPGLIFASRETAARLAGEGLPPVEIAEDIPAGTAITDIAVARRLLGQTETISRFVVAQEQPLGRAPLSVIVPDLELRKPDAQGDLARLTDSFHLNLTAFGMLAFVVGLFIVYSTIGLAFEQRRPTLRTLRSLGLPVRALTILLVTELAALSLVAGFFGVALGYLVASALLPDVAATLRGLYGADVPGTLQLRPEWWATGLVIAVAGTLAAAGQNLWRAVRMPLLAPAQPRAWARASEAGLRAQAVAAVSLFAVALTLTVWGQGLVAGFALLGALLLGAALLLPVLLMALLALFERLSSGPVSAWFWADTRQQLPRLSLALMALLLALAANIGVGTMVASFRLTFTGWLDQRLAAELYVTARTEDEARALRSWLEPRVDAVLPIWHVEGEVLGGPAEIYGVADHATYREKWPLIESVQGVWDAVARGDAAVVNEQLARRHGITPGDRLTLPGGWRVTVAGIYSDYGNPIGQVIVGIDALTTHYPEVPRLRFGLRLPPAEAPALAEALRTEFDLPPQNVLDQATIKQRSLQVFERTFAVTAALNVLTLGVAGVAMFASLTTLSGIRLAQIAPVWAMGLTRKRLVLLELLRTMLLSAFTLVAALPTGVALAWVLLSVVNVAAFGWRLPMHLFPTDWLRLASLAGLAALVSVAIPLRRLARMTPADLLKVFANER